MNCGLKQRDIDYLTAAFRQFPQIRQVLIFGSRAKGTSKPASDIDLALKGPDVSQETIARLRDVLDDLPLPFFIDIVDYETVQNNELIEHIDRVGQVIYENPTNGH